MMTDGLVAEIDESIELRRDRSEVATARSFVRAELAVASSAVIADATLIVSELVTNAVEHGVGEPIVVGLALLSDAVVIQVTSVGPSPEVGPPSGWRPAAPAATSGRGLGIVASIASQVGVDVADGRLVTTVRLAH